MTVTVTEDAVIEQEQDVDPSAQPVEAPALVDEDLLVEDVSIDGMCGVY